MPYTFSSPTHTCVLETHQCAWHAGCRRQVTIGLDLCWQHCRKQYGVKVAPSSLGGRGLFAVRDVARGASICPYGGRLLTTQEAEQLYPGDTLAPYMEQISSRAYRDAACVRGVGAMANGTRRKADSNAETYVREGRMPWLRAHKRIRAGDEILNHYGPEYFAGDTIHTSVTRYHRPMLKKSAHTEAPKNISANAT